MFPVSATHCPRQHRGPTRNFYKDRRQSADEQPDRLTSNILRGGRKKTKMSRRLSRNPHELLAAPSRQGAVRHSLIESIDAHRVVRAGPANAFRSFLAHITAGARINQERLSIDGIAHTERVRMPMTAAHRAQRPGIDHDLLRNISGISRDVEASIGKRSRTRRCSYRSRGKK